MDTRSRLSALYADLSNIDSTNAVGWPVGLAFNALLDAAKNDHPDDPVVAALEPVIESANGRLIANMNAGTLRAMVGQVLDAYPPQGPAIG